MLRRRLVQKPSEELLSTFKIQYPDVLLPQESSTTTSTTTKAGQTSKLASDANNFQGNQGRNNGLSTSDNFTTVQPMAWSPRGLLNPDIDGFHDPNALGGYWPPTPHGSSGYLSRQDIGISQGPPYGLETPTSGSAHFLGFASGPHDYHAAADFMGPQRIDSFESQHSFHVPNSLPPQVLHQLNSNAGAGDVQLHGLHMNDVALPQSYAHSPPSAPARPQHQALEDVGPRHVVDAMNQFRFRTILKAQTAMIKHPHDTSVTYLNKSQVYTIQVDDCLAAQARSNHPLKYRTAVRISFDDEQQRKDPAASWQLWKDGRGVKEAGKRGQDSPKAVEFVNQDQYRNKHQVVHESFDGFSVIWSHGNDEVATGNLQLRFNFLSTDFSHSKGVKGQPVRLCAKTEIIEDQPTFQHEVANREISYCVVKIFRDHGAERKHINDVAHVSKLVEKFTHQAEQAEAGFKETGKRRRSDSMVASSRPAKIAKHKRTWSASSSGSLEELQEPAEDELRVRIRSLKTMPTSVRPVSAFYLKGDEEDDLDSHPIILASTSLTVGSPSRSGPPSLKTETTQTTTRSTGPQSETPTSRSPSALRVKSELLHRQYSGSSDPSPIHTLPNKSPIKQELSRITSQHSSPPSSGVLRTIEKPPPSIPTPQLGTVLDVDADYQPPSELKPRAVAELFMKPSISFAPPENDLYRAIYLTERTLTDLVRAIAAKCQIDSSAVVSVIRVNDQGLNVAAEDDMVEQMPDRQDFIAELDILENHYDTPGQFFSEGSAEYADTTLKYKLTLRY